MNESRRHFLKLGAASVASCLPLSALAEKPRFQISLAQWSMNRSLFGGELDHLDWAKHTKENFGIEALEYVNQFFAVGDRKKDKWGFQPKPQAYLAEMKTRTDDLGMTNVLIMCDGVGNLGDPDEKRRTNAVEGHYSWCDAAKFLGCHSIRVNARSNDNLSADEQKAFCVDGLRRLSEHATPMGLSVIVENHGGLSSHGAWLAGVMKEVDLPNCGTLPDFGNFYLVRNRGNDEAYQQAKANFVGLDLQEDEIGLYYDRYQGIADLMPYAKGVSAKSFAFDQEGNDLHTDFQQAMQIVSDSGYRGYVGVEFEGKEISETEGIMKTKALLEKTFAAVS